MKKKERKYLILKYIFVHQLDNTGNVSLVHSEQIKQIMHHY